MVAVGTISDFLEGFAPRSLAESWDNVGLLVGDRAAQVSRIMTCLSVTPESAREAIERQAELIVTHHPVLFRPVQRLTADTGTGRMMLDLIRAGIAIYSPHTAFDSTANGINDMLAERLGVQDPAPLRPVVSPAKSKLVVFVPDNDLDKVLRAMFDGGAGEIGEYRECSFRVAGRGTFFGSESSNPTVGQAGRREEVEEWRVEVVCPQVRVPAIVAAMREAHSYEEPAYDIYPLGAEPLGKGGGGRLGELTARMGLDQLAGHVRAALNSPLVQVVGDAKRSVRKVAVSCGSGAEFLGDAIATGCDVLVTGEATFHRQLEARAAGIAMILAGHYATERFAVESLASLLAKEFPQCTAWASELESDPARNIS